MTLVLNQTAIGAVVSTLGRFLHAEVSDKGCTKTVLERFCQSKSMIVRSQVT